MGDQNKGPHQMALRLAESLIQQKSFNAQDVFVRYLTWFHNREIGYDDTGPVGASVFHSFSSIDRCRQLTSSDFNSEVAIAVTSVDNRLLGNTAGANTAHRNIVLSMASFLDMKNLLSAARSEAKLTHLNDMAAEVSIICNFICRKLILQEYSQELDSPHVLHQLLSLPELKSYVTSDQVTLDLKYLLVLTDGKITNKDHEQYLKKLPRGGFAPNVLKVALYFVYKHTQDIRSFSQMENQQATQIVKECMDESFEFAGKANYCPVLVGPVLGALFGSQAFATCSVEHCPDLSRLQKACDKLAADW